MAKPLNDDLDFPVPAAYADDLRRARKGIDDPSIKTLRKGECLFRVTSSRTPGTEAPRNVLDMLSSPWWWRATEWSKIQDWLDAQHGYNPGEAFRPLGAVTYGGSYCDRRLTAVVGHDIKVFYGPGTPQFETVPGGPHIVYQPSSDLLQLYVPGIVERVRRFPDEDPKPTLNDAGWQVLTYTSPPQPIESRDDLGIRSLPEGTLVHWPGTRWLN